MGCVSSSDAAPNRRRRKTVAGEKAKGRRGTLSSDEEKAKSRRRKSSARGKTDTAWLEGHRGKRRSTHQRQGGIERASRDPSSAGDLVSMRSGGAPPHLMQLTKATGSLTSPTTSAELPSAHGSGEPMPNPLSTATEERAEGPLEEDRAAVAGTSSDSDLWGAKPVATEEDGCEPRHPSTTAASTLSSSGRGASLPKDSSSKDRKASRGGRRVGSDVNHTAQDLAGLVTDPSRSGSSSSATHSPRAPGLTLMPNDWRQRVHPRTPPTGPTRARGNEEQAVAALARHGTRAQVLALTAGVTSGSAAGAVFRVASHHHGDPPPAPVPPDLGSEAPVGFSRDPRRSVSTLPPMALLAVADSASTATTLPPGGASLSGSATSHPASPGAPVASPMTGPGQTMSVSGRASEVDLLDAHSSTSRSVTNSIPASSDTRPPTPGNHPAPHGGASPPFDALH